MSKRRETTEEFLNKSIRNLSKVELESRKKRLEKLLDEVSSPTWYSIVVEKYNEVRNALEGQSNPSILKKLRKGIRGHIKLSRGRLIIKT